MRTFPRSESRELMSLQLQYPDTNILGFNTLSGLLEYLDTPKATEDERARLTRQIAEAQESLLTAEAGVETKTREVASFQSEGLESAIALAKRELAGFEAEVRRLTEELEKLKAPDFIAKRIAVRRESAADAQRLFEAGAREQQRALTREERQLAEADTQREKVLDNLAAARAATDLIANPTDRAETISRNDLIFAITANLTRVGAILVVVFFARMFFAVYRYSMHLAGYYNGRADAIELAGRQEGVDPKLLSETVIRLAPVLSPDAVEVGRPKPPIDELAKLATAIEKVRGT